MAEAARRRVWAATLAAMAAAIAGCSAPSGPSAAAGVPPPAARSPEASAVAPDGGGAGSTRIVGGVPMGYRHDDSGAAAAALEFTRFGEVLVGMDEAEATEPLRVIAAAAGSGEFVERTVEELTRLRSRWPAGTVSYRVAPLGVAVDPNGTDAAEVRVWYVGLVAADNAPIYADWATDHYRLVWEDDDWRVEGFSSDPGPRPSVARPAAPDDGASRAALADLERVP